MMGLHIAICGCGPAGLTAALLLHRAGHCVQLFERFNKPQPIGSGLLLQPTGLAVLAELGLLDNITHLGTPIARLYGLTESKRVALDVKFDALGQGWRALGIHRSALFDVLYEEVTRHSLQVATATQVAHVAYMRDKIVLRDTQLRTIGEFDLVVNALGANSPLSANIARRTVLEYGALWTNIPWPNDAQLKGFNYSRLEQRYRRASQMIGVLPIGKSHIDAENQAAFFWSIKRGALNAWRAEPLDAWKDRIVTLWPAAELLLATINSHEQLTFAQYDHFTAEKPYANRLAHIGDAAHATSPQLGQGANMALLDAFALSLALQSHADIGAALARYADMRRWHVRLFQYASALFTPFYQSDSHFLPWLRDWITAPLSRLPIGDAVVARLVSGMTTAPLAGTNFVPVRLGSNSESGIG